MNPARPTRQPATNPPRAARPRWAWGACAVAVAGLALGGWYLSRERARAAERNEILSAARFQNPDAGARLAARLARDPDDAELTEALVVWSMRAGKPFAEYEPHLDRLCALRPDDPAPWRTRAEQRIHNGRAADGIADGLRALDLAPDDHALRRLVATTALDAGDLDVAARELERLLQAPLPDAEGTAALLVTVHARAGAADRAERVLNQHFPTSRTDPESRFLRGLVHQAAGRHAEAAGALREAADRSPKYRARALHALAKSLSAAGREADARRALDELDALQSRERAVRDARQRPDDLPAQVRAAEALLTDGQPKEAAAVLERATARLGRSPGAAAVLARAYRQLGREDLARQWER